jgi:hypothetical protein
VAYVITDDPEGHNIRRLNLRTGEAVELILPSAPPECYTLGTSLYRFIYVPNSDPPQFLELRTCTSMREDPTTLVRVRQIGTENRVLGEFTCAGWHAFPDIAEVYFAGEGGLSYYRLPDGQRGEGMALPGHHLGATICSPPYDWVLAVAEWSPSSGDREAPPVLGYVIGHVPTGKWIGRTVLPFDRCWGGTMDFSRRALLCDTWSL